MSSKIISSDENMQNQMTLYIKNRDAFRSNPRAKEELEHWKKKDSKYEYDVLKGGLIPSEKVGKGDPARANGDTWFSEYKFYNGGSKILSESNDSYIIGNIASYDKRQYPLWLNPKTYKVDKTPESQGFGHCLVIPKQRIFNIVDPEAVANRCTVIKEMYDHFDRFWNSTDGREILLLQTRFSFEAQLKIIAGRLKGSPWSIKFYDKLRETLENDFNGMAEHFTKLKVDDFVIGFHPYPYNSVGHLHMHVFPRLEELRAHSAYQHDWKTIAIEAVIEAEEEGL